jgi:hypothetical protein
VLGEPVLPRPGAGRRHAGDHAAAARLLHDAPAACRRVTDANVWVEAYGLAAQAAHALSRGLPHALDLVDDLDRLASAHGIGELRAEAALLRLAAGRPGALDAARSHVAVVDNPVLAARLARLEDSAGGSAVRAAEHRPRTGRDQRPGRARG